MGKLHLLVTHFDDASDKVDPQIANHENRSLSARLKLVTERRSQAGKKLIHREWLRYKSSAPKSSA
jgi:hypothetical protein